MAITTFSDIHPDIIQTHILPRLDGPSLSTTATASSYLQSLCADDDLWTDVSKSTWPSINHPHVHDVISTFPNGYRSFFDDSFPALITDIQPHTFSKPSDLDLSSQLISAVDIRYQNNIIYSTLEITETRSDSVCSAFRIELNNKPTGNYQSIDLEVDELVGANKETLSHLKESLTLNWILIDPTLKRAGNLSSIKPVSARPDWTTNETLVRYVTVLPGRVPKEVVQCKIQVVLGAGKGGAGLHVKEVSLKLQDLDCKCLNKREFLVITQGALLEDNNVKRKVVDEEEIRKRYLQFKHIKKQKNEWVKKEEEKREFGVKMVNILLCVSFLCSVYSLFLMLR